MPKRYWWILVSYILCQLSGFVAIPLLTFLPPDQRQGFWITVSFLLTLSIAFMLLLPELGGDRHVKRAGFTSTVKWSFYGIVLIYLTQIAASIIDVALFGAPQKSENTEEVMELANMTPYVMFVIVLAGPILEEIIFRKIIFGAIAQKTNFWIGALISSLLFAFAHFDGHLIIYTSIGLVLCYLYSKTKRLIVSITAHAAMNALVVIRFLPAIQKMIEEQERQNLSLITWLFNH